VARMNLKHEDLKVRHHGRPRAAHGHRRRSSRPQTRPPEARLRHNAMSSPDASPPTARAPEAASDLASFEPSRILPTLRRPAPR